MSTDDLRRALEALASEHGLPILRYLRGRDWALASQVAEGLGIHTTTASKHLAAFHEAGLLERRDHPARRPTHAYRLVSPLIRIEFDLGEQPEAADAAEAAEAFVAALLEGATRVEGHRLADGLAEALFNEEDWRHALRERFAAASPRTALDALIRDARRTCAEVVGGTTADRLIRLALEIGFEGRHDLLPEVIL